MQIKEITYAQLVNTGNYENKRAEVTVIINEGDSVDDAFSFAKDVVADALGLDVPSSIKDVRQPEPVIENEDEDDDEEDDLLPDDDDINYALEILDAAGIEYDLYDEYGNVI